MFWFSCLGLLSSLAHTNAPLGQVQQDILSLVLIALKGGRWTKMQSLALKVFQIIGICSSARMLLWKTPRSSHNSLGIVKVLFITLSRLSLQPPTPVTLLLKVPPLSLPFLSSKILNCPAPSLHWRYVPLCGRLVIHKHTTLDKRQASLGGASQDRAHAWNGRRCAERKNDPYKRHTVFLRQSVTRRW